MTALLVAFAVHAQGGEMPPVSIDVGDKAPAFGCPDDRGWTWNLSDKLPEKYLVLVFYQGDFHPCSNKQLLAYRANWQALVERNVDVVAISGDSVETHGLYKELFCLNFLLLADEDGSVADKFAVPYRPGGKARVRDLERKSYPPRSRDWQLVERGVTCSRCTLLIGPDGTVLYKKTDVDPATDCRDVFLAIDQHQHETR